MTHDVGAAGGLVLVESAEGILAIGPSAAVEEWQSSAGVGRVTRLEQPDNRALALAGELLPQLIAPKTAFLPRSRGATGAGTAGTSTELRLLARGRDGRYTSSTLIDPRQLAVSVAMPQLIVIQAAIQVVSQELGQIRETLDEVKEGVEELLRAADAERLGDVYGRHRVLAGMVTELQEGHRLTTTDWDAIASQGPILQVGTEKLRRYLVQQLNTVVVDAAPGARARTLRRLVDSGRVGDLLKLLVTAQESLALYQRIRLERVYDKEPEAVEQTVSSISRILAENLRLDTELAQEFRRVLNESAVLRPAEGLDLLNGRSLERSRKALAEVVDEFLSYRETQVEDWELPENAGIRDALGHFRDRGVGVINTGRRAAAKGLDAVVRKIEPKE